MCKKKAQCTSLQQLNYLLYRIFLPKKAIYLFFSQTDLITMHSAFIYELGGNSEKVTMGFKLKKINK